MRIGIEVWHSLGAICVRPASIVICVGKFSEFALSCMSNKQFLDWNGKEYYTGDRLLSWNRVQKIFSASSYWMLNI